MTRTWKLLPLALLAALGLLMLVPGTGQIGVPVAHASVTAVGDAPDPIIAGGTSVITITATEPGNAISLIAGLPDGSLGTITGATCAMLVVGGAACTNFTHAPIAFGTYSQTISVADDGTSNGTVVVIQATFQSTVPTIVGYTASQAGGSDMGGTITVNSSGTTTATPTVTGTPSTATPTLTPTVTGTISSAIQTIRVSATGPINCGGTSLITAVLTNANGASVPGTSVTISSNLGTVSPTTAIDQGGGILAALTAPAAQGGIATITVTAGGISGSAQVTINCAAATTVPTSPPPVATSASVIQPPRTGDAGLLARTPAWRLSLGFALIAASLLGSLAVLRRT